jgi:hypothetical protein
MIPQFGEVIETCDRNTERTANKCDDLYRAYKCFWDERRTESEPDSVRHLFEDIFGLNQLYDEAEIEADKLIPEPSEEVATK